MKLQGRGRLRQATPSFNPPIGGRVDETYPVFVKWNQQASFNPPIGGRVDETPRVVSRFQLGKSLAFNPPIGGRVDETAPAETLIYTSWQIHFCRLILNCSFQLFPKKKVDWRESLKQRLGKSFESLTATQGFCPRFQPSEKDEGGFLLARRRWGSCHDT